MRKQAVIGVILILGAIFCFYSEDYARSYVILTDSVGNNLHWTANKIPVKYYINLNGTPDCSDEFAAVKAGFKTWTDVPGCTAAAEYVSDTSVLNEDSPDKRVVAWIESDFPYGDGDTLAICMFQWHENGTGELIDADIYFNGTHTWATSGAPNKADIQAVITHEIGHFFGLDHSASAAAVMFPTMKIDDTSKRKLDKDDIAGITTLYPGPPESPTPTPTGSITPTPGGGGTIPPTATPTANITPTPSAGLLITTDALPYGRLEEYYEFQLDAIGGTAPYTFSIESGELPDGLKMEANGFIVGNPLAICEKTIGFKVTDDRGKFSAVTTLKFTVYDKDAVVGPVISNGVLPTGYVGSLYQASLVVGGGVKPYRIIVYYTSALPSGLSMGLDGKISGVPATTFDQDVEFMVTDAEGKFNRKFLRCTVLPADSRPSDINFDVLMEKEAFNVSDPLTLKVAVSGSGTGDVYVAMIKPNGNFQALTPLGQLAQDNEVVSIVPGWQITPGVYTAFSSNVQQNWAPGLYSWYIIIAKPGSSPLDVNNWTVWTFREFRIN